MIGALTPVVVTHHAALTEPRAVGALLRAIDGYRGEPVTRIALQLLPLVFLRSTELRFSTWSQIDFDAAEWRIPARRMKMREMHIVPLCSQAIDLLRELQPLTARTIASLLATSAPAASFGTDSIASLAADDDQPFEEPAMLNRFLPLASLERTRGRVRQQRSADLRRA